MDGFGIFSGMTTYPMTLSTENVGQGYSLYENDGVIARYNGRERLWTVGRSNLRQIKMKTG